MHNHILSEIISWVDIPAHSDFSIYNLPYGIFSSPRHSARAGIRIGDYIIDLQALSELNFLDSLAFDKTVFQKNTLNEFIGLGKNIHQQFRNRLIELLTLGNGSLKNQANNILVPAKEVEMHLPIYIRDYTDFYSSEEHATNVGKMFRDPANALLPNWKHLPVGYHGRASSIVVSGTPIIRPWGQVKSPEQTLPQFKPTQMLDFELEVAFVIGKSTQLGQRISTSQAEDYIFGLVLFNDWSARDIQSWEYVPLGPFLGKNFASSISPWIVPMEALAAFKTNSPIQEPPVLSYLAFEGAKNYDINLEVAITAPQQGEKIICQSNFKYLYWNMSQQLAHHTVNGCNLNIGDLCASGTISGKEPHSFGSMLELTWRGSNPLSMPDGSLRKFLEDYDTVTMRGYCQKNNVRVGFGEVSGQILPAIPC
ncbi:MAG: fumarylacetoacetase [Thermoflexibacter sp.]|nr:fumarylacetoacetase [Thermoflexibacter sp.]